MRVGLVVQDKSKRLGNLVVWFMSISAALGTAAIYPLQPAIAVLAESMSSSVTWIGLALACGPIGYLCGLALLVPLVDRFPPRHVLSAQFGLLAVALALSSAVSSVWVMGPTIAVIGACSSVGAGLSSVVGRLAPARRRATMLGMVTAGIAAGILAGRIVGGWLSDAIGWRGMLLVLAGCCVVVALGCLLALPADRGEPDRGYLATLRSIPALIMEDAVLRGAAIRGALWFFAFCAVWAGVSVALAGPPYSYSAERIGLYAVAGLLGMVATQVSGAWTDRVGARRVTIVGLVLAGAAAAVLGVALPNTALTLACLAIFDAGLFAAQVANQSAVLSIDPGAPARFNSAYMCVYFVGGSLGTGFGAAAVDQFGWLTTALVSTAAIGMAAAGTLHARIDVRSMSSSYR